MDSKDSYAQGVLTFNMRYIRIGDMFKHRYNGTDIIFGTIGCSVFMVILLHAGQETGLFSMIRIFSLSFLLFWVIDRVI